MGTVPIRLGAWDCPFRRFPFGAPKFGDYMSKQIHPTIITLTVAVLAILISSCGKTDRKPVYHVQGKVFDKNNRPAVDALVVFHPLDSSDANPVKPIARVDDKGNFALTTYEKNDGGPEGEYVITIEWRRPASNPFGPNKEGKDLLLGSFSNPKTSKLKFKISNQTDNTVPPIYLH